MHSNILIIFNVIVLLLINCEGYHYYFHYESKLDTERWLNETDYPFKKYEVISDDGYILTLHRMINPYKPAILLMDGLIATSMSYLFQGPGRALAYMLYDRGYDVWLGNTRGSKYSQKHVTLDALEDDYWGFTLHEQGLYDLPVVIDKILGVTGHETLTYVGHSRSYTTFLILMSLRPEYNAKINKAILMSPVSRWYKDDYSQTVSCSENDCTIHPLHYPTKNLYNSFYEYCPIESYLSYSNECKVMHYIGTGMERKRKFMPITEEDLKDLPVGASFTELMHYQYIFETNLFTPMILTWTEYNLTLITTPIVMFYSCDDDYSWPALEVGRVVYKSSGPTDVYEIKEPDFGPNDFIWGHKATDLVYNIVIKEVMKPVDKKRRPINVHHTVQFAKRSNEVIIKKEDKIYNKQC